MPDLPAIKRTFPAKEIGVVFLTELVIVGFFAVPLWFGNPVLIAIMLVVMLLGIYLEIIRLIGRLSLKLKITIGVICAALFFLLYRSYIPPYIQWIAAGLVVILLIVNIYITFSISFQKWLLFYPVLLVPFIAFLAFDNGYSRTALFTYLIVESFDSFAYLGGKLFGKTKAFPTLSPKKTIEGVLIGVACALTIGFLAGPYMIGFRFSQLLPLLMLIIVGTLYGDLSASKIKRSLGVKDYGHILPLQGGVLDIYDSIIFTAPIVFIYLKLVP